MVLRLLWILWLVLLVLVLVVTSSGLTSSTSTIATSTSAVIFVSSIAISHHRILASRVPLILLHSMDIAVALVLIPHVVDDVENLLLGSFLMFTFDVILWLPEVNSKWLHAVFEWARLIKIFNAFLGVWYVFIKNITDFVVGELLSVDALLVILKLDWSNLTSFGEFGDKLIVGDFLRDEFNKNVRFIGVFEVLNNWVWSASNWLTEVVLFSVDVRGNKKSLISDLLLHVDSINSCLCLFVGLETNEASSVVLGIHCAWNDITELLENGLELITLESLWQVSDKQICVFVLSLFFSIILLCVDENLDGLSTLIGTIKGLNCCLSALLSLKLNIPLSSAVSTWECFEFARFDITILLEQSLQRLLIHVLWKISDKEISFTIEITVFLLVENNLFAINNSIALFAQTSEGFSLIIEIQVSITLGLASISIEHDLSTGELVTLDVEILVEIKIKSLLRKVANVETHEVVVMLSFLIWLISSSLHLETKIHWANSKIHSLHCLTCHSEHLRASHITTSLEVLLLSILLTSSLVVLKLLAHLLLLHEHLLLSGWIHWLTTLAHELSLRESLLASHHLLLTRCARHWSLLWSSSLLLLLLLLLIVHF